MVDLRFGSLFPWPIRLVALFGIIGAFGILQPYPLWALILFLGCGLVLSAAEGTEINISNSTYREYTSYLFFKSGKFDQLPPIEKIFITKGKETQQMHTVYTNHSATFDSIVYNGYLKFSSGEKIHLLRTKNKDRLMAQLAPLRDGIKTDIVDHS